jgi:hypothetical protein
VYSCDFVILWPHLLEHLTVAEAYFFSDIRPTYSPRGEVDEFYLLIIEYAGRIVNDRDLHLDILKKLVL